VFGLAGDVQRAAAALGHAFLDQAPASPFNEPISPQRHLAMTSRPLRELCEIKERYRTTVNDVVLAVCAGAVRRYLEDHGQPPLALKAMVPVSVREAENGSELGNRIVFIFMRLPCGEPDPVRRLTQINQITRERKQAGEPRGAESVFGVVSHSPHVVQRLLTRLIASPRTFNLVVSNIPGPTAPLFMHGCRLIEAYPVVPLADRHALSIGVSTVCGRACFGLYADRRALPDADLLARELNREIEQLVLQTNGGSRRVAERPARRPLAPAP
jgi:WS/DGAT/MGAT family acyltransferase